MRTREEIQAKAAELQAYVERLEKERDELEAEYIEWLKAPSIVVDVRRISLRLSITESSLKECREKIQMLEWVLGAEDEDD